MQERIIVFEIYWIYGNEVILIVAILKYVLDILKKKML